MTLILSRKASADEQLAEVQVQFSEKWSDYKLISRELEQRTYELDILRNIRNSFGAGSRSNLSTASLARRILLGNKYRNLRASDLEIPEEFSKLKHRRSTGLLGWLGAALVCVPAALLLPAAGLPVLPLGRAGALGRDGRARLHPPGGETDPALIGAQRARPLEAQVRV